MPKSFVYYGSFRMTWNEGHDIYMQETYNWICCVFVSFHFASCWYILVTRGEILNANQKLLWFFCHKAWKLGSVSLHTSYHCIHMVDFMPSSSMMANINCSIKEFILSSNAMTRNIQQYIEASYNVSSKTLKKKFGLNLRKT